MRGYVVDGFSSTAGRKIDNHQIGYSALHDHADKISHLFVLLLTGAFVSTVTPYAIMAALLFYCPLKCNNNEMRESPKNAAEDSTLIPNRAPGGLDTGVDQAKHRQRTPP